MTETCPLMDLSDKILDMANHDEYDEELCHDGGISLMVAAVALQVARQQLIRLGGDGSDNKIQKAVIDQIDVALKRR